MAASIRTARSPFASTRPSFILQSVLSAVLPVLLVAACCLPAAAQMQPVPVITTVAGGGSGGDGGAATSAELIAPSSVAMDGSGNLYIADEGNHRVRMVAASTGIITTVAGTGTYGYSGDGGPAINAKLDCPYGVAVDGSGNLYIADANNNVIRMVAASTSSPFLAGTLTPGYIYTVAGTGQQGNYSGDGGAATSAMLFAPQSVAIDGSGNLYIADVRNQRVRMVAASTSTPFVASTIKGYIYTVAGTGATSYNGDGIVATTAALSDPWGLAFDGSDNLYIADSWNFRIRMVAASTSSSFVPGTLIPGYIYTVVGNSTQAQNTIGDLGTITELGLPYGVAFDGSGNLYIADGRLNRIFMMPASTSGSYTAGNIYTVAGDGDNYYIGDGIPATSAGLSIPYSVAFDGSGNLFIADTNDGRIRKVSVAGTSVTETTFSFPATAVGSSATVHNVVLQTTAAETISRIIVPSMSVNPEFSIGTITGCTVNGSTSNPAGTTCTVPITFSPAYPGSRQVPLQVVTSAGKVNYGLVGFGTGPQAALTPGIISTVAGNGTSGFSGDGDDATSAGLFSPLGVAVDAAGNFYIADTSNNRIRKVIASKNLITTVAGGGNGGDEGAATSAALYSPQSVAVDAAGNLYIADTLDHRIRKVTAATGIITTVAGNGTGGYNASDDGGLATSAELNSPYGVAVDAAGNLYIADTLNNRIRKVTAATGIITTLAGGAGTYNFGGPATGSLVNRPYAVAVDAAGNVYIADQANNVYVDLADVVTMVAATTSGSHQAGYIYLVAGGGENAYTDGILATDAQLYSPGGVAVDAAGNVYIADTYNKLIRKVTAATGIITTVAGNTISGYTADGVAATSSELNYPWGVAVDAAGNVYIADTFNQRIRKVTVNQPLLNYPTATAVGTLDSTDGPVTVTVSNTGNSNLTIAVPTSGKNPSISSGFLNNSASTCLQLTTGSSAYTLASGNSCTYAVDFEPTTGGAVTGSLVLTDNSLNVTGATQSASLTGTGIAALAATQAIATTALALNRAATAFTPVTGSGGTAPLSYSVSPALPAGLSMASATGAITGTPTALSSAATYTVTVTDANSATATATFSLTVATAPTATQVIATTSLMQSNPSFTTFTPVTGSGGTGTLSYSVSPALPTGLSMSQLTGAIVGSTPTIVIAATTYTVTVTDANGLTATANFSLEVTTWSQVVVRLAIPTVTLNLNHAVTPFTPVVATGGYQPLEWTVSPFLPFGLSISSTTGEISGTPQVLQTSTLYVVKASDTRSSAAWPFSLAVVASLTATQAIPTETLILNRVATSFTPVTGSGGTAPLSYSVSPALPTGLTMASWSGSITGTPTELSSATTYTVTVSDANSNTAMAAFSLTINSVLTATQAIATTLLTQNRAVTAFTPVTGSGGTPPLSYSVSPALPAGLSMASATGSITGTPTAVSSATTYTVTVSDALTVTARATFSLTVAPALTATQAIATTSLALNRAATTITPVTGSGGTAPLSYSVSPALPAGLSMASATGAITGTPTAASSATTYTVTVTDATNATATATFSLMVATAPTATQVIATTSLIEDNPNFTNFTPVVGAGGTGTLTYSVSPALPTGLSMSRTGVIGRATQPGVTAARTYTVTVTDANGLTATANFSLEITEYKQVWVTLAIPSVTLMVNHAATPFTPVVATGGYPPVRYSAYPVALPYGLNISSTTGEISGTPINVLSSTFVNILATDGVSSASWDFSLKIVASVTATQAIPTTTLTQNVTATAFTPVTGAGGAAPLSYSVSPALPTGLTMASGTGSISGKPTSASSATTYTVTVTDANSATATATFSLAVHAPVVAVTVPRLTNFGSVAVGSSVSQTITVTFTESGSIGAPVVVTQGAIGLDFVDAATGTCNANGSSYLYHIGDTCTVNVTFTPKYAGLRQGAALLKDGLGNVLATAYLYGTGTVAITGPQISFFPATISTVAGTGPGYYGGDGGAATSAELNDPFGVTLDGASNLYIADTYNNVIRKVEVSTGIISTVAGNGYRAGSGSGGYSGDGGAATSAELNSPRGVTLDGASNLYIADTGNQRIRKVDALTGTISTVAGNGTAGYSGDGGAATSAELYVPAGIMLDGAGNLYFAAGSEIRKVDASTGTISTVAGNGTEGYSGDGGLATRAELYNSESVTLDGTGNLYIADATDCVIREVDASSGIIRTVAGNGTCGFSGDGRAATSAELFEPWGVTLDSAGNLYIADYINQRIRKVDASTGIISTVGGNGNQGYDGDGGAATSAAVVDPTSITFDSTGNLYIAAGSKIRKVSAGTTPSLSFATWTPAGSTDTTDGPQSVTVTNTGTATLTISGLTAPADFIQVKGSGTPADCAANSSLAVNASCNLSIEFKPTQAGNPLRESFVLTDNATSATQSISLSGRATGTVIKTVATVTLMPSSLSQNYNGAAHVVTTSTIPAGLTVVCTYNGSSTPPTAAGSYAVVATIADANYQGSTTGTLVISMAVPSVTTWPTASPITYEQTLASSTLTGGASTPIGSFAFTTPTTAPGVGTASQSVTFTPTDRTDYSTVTGTASVTVSKAAATVTLMPSSLTQNYNGAVHVVTTSTNPTGLTVVCTYNGSSTPPTAAGSYAVVATIADANYQGSTTGTLVISVAVPTVTAWPTASAITYGQTLASSTLSGGTASVSGSFAFTTPGTKPDVGTALEGVTFTPTDSSNNASTVGTVSVTVSKAAQTITFAQPPTPVVYGVSPLTLSATGGASGNAIVFSIVSGPGSISGNTLSITGAGTVVVAANQDGNASYNRAAQVTRSIVVVTDSISFSVTGLAFGSVPVGLSSPAQTVVITNPYGMALTLSGISASGDFSAASNCPVLAAYGTCSINVVFTPTSIGASTGTLTVSDSQLGLQQTAALTGTGTAAAIQISPAVLNFGSQTLTTTSAAQAITIQNTGMAALAISGIVTSGDFATSSNCASIPAGSECSLIVTFTPTATGALTGTVTFTDTLGSSSQSQTVNLAGTGIAAGATLTPSVLSFPATVAGASSFAQSITLTNTGTASLTGISISIQGDFTQTNACAATLNAGASCTIGVTYAPTVAGAESGSLTVIDNVGTQTASLQGIGQAAGASLSTAQLTFGSQQVGTSSRAQTIVFTNTGSIAASITSVDASTNFTDTTNCSGTLAAGSSCSVNVFFAPTATGSLSGTVTFSDSVGTQAVTLQGQGIDAGLTVTPSFAIFGAQVVGTTSQAQTLTATNSGTVPLTLAPITVSGNFATSNQCPATLQVGASCLISVSFSPNAAGTLSGSLVIGDTSGQASAQAIVSGQGTVAGIVTSPSTLSFGSLPVGSTSQAQTVTVTNTGTAALQIGAISGTGDFAETDNCASSTLAAGSYCLINVTMTPTTTGTRTGSIQINNGVDGAHTIALTGMGQEAGASISPTNLAFGSLPYVSTANVSLSTGTSLNVTVTNTGNTALTLGGFSTQGDFSESDSCGSTIAVGAACTLTVTFVPTAVGHRTGTLTITDNAGGGTQMVSLEGDGSPVGLTLTPAVLDFGVQTVGITSASQTATLTNNTGGSITELSIAASGGYTESDDCGSTLAAGSSCTLSITVKPAITGAITGAITVSGTSSVLSSASREAQIPAWRTLTSSSSSNFNLGVVALSATAIPPGISVSIPKLSFSITSVGTPSTGQTITLQNTGTSLSLTNLQISETNAAEFPFNTTCTATLPAQATCSITVNFSPSAYGLRSGIMNITADGNLSAALPESGTATAPALQLSFGTVPAASITVGGNAGSSITVFEKDGSGNLDSSATDTIRLVVTGPGSYGNTYTAKAVAGVASFNLSSSTLTTAGTYTYTASIPQNSASTSAIASEAVTLATATVSVSASINPVLLQSAVTFTATVGATAGTPTGTVTFLDGATPLGTGKLGASGLAMLTTSSLSKGSHSISATYNGDTSYAASSSNAVTLSVLDYTLSSTSTALSATAGGTVTYALQLAPSTGSVLPVSVTVTLSGLPDGATASTTSSSWTNLSATSWSLPANTAMGDLSLTLQLPATVANREGQSLPGRKIPPMLWGILLLPLASKLRRAGKRFNRMLPILLLLIASIAAITGVSGCGSSTGFYGGASKSYTITATATADSLSRSTTLTLTVK
jgi:sugar lactone lactonase YvrE